MNPEPEQPSPVPHGVSRRGLLGAAGAGAVGDTAPTSSGAGAAGGAGTGALTRVSAETVSP